MNKCLGPVAMVLSLGFCLPSAQWQEKAAPSAPDSSRVAGKTKEGAAKAAAGKQVEHVLMISIDGMHALDLSLFVKAHPDSVLAQLARRGTTYTNAVTTIPSDSTPGMLAMATGGTPNSTGVYYSDGYDRTLSPAGSKCATRGAVVLFDETADYDENALDAGGGINPEKMPLDPRRGCAHVFPHDFLRVNTIFEVVKAHGGRTAWIDGHPTYGDFLNGWSGKDLDDVYTPEVHAKGMKDTVPNTEKYDGLKVAAILSQIHGKDHTGKTKAPVPTIFGLNFVTVSAAQKLAGNGYLDGSGTPSPGLVDALLWTDKAIGQIVEALRDEHLYSSTAIFLTAKHGQSPMDAKKRRLVDEDAVPEIVESVQKGLLAHSTVDTVALVWLKDQSRTEEVVNALRAKADQAGIEEIYAGESLKLFFNDPKTDPRAPDILVQPYLGVIYADGKTTKLAEHGGLHDEDTHVPLLVSYPGGTGTEFKMAVQIAQVAPTALRLLGLNPTALKSVVAEHTATLPGLGVR